MLDHSHKPSASAPTVVQRFLREREVIALTGFGSRSAFRKEVDEGRFPSPVRISVGRIAWPEHEVSRWQCERIAARDEKN